MGLFWSVLFLCGVLRGIRSAVYDCPLGWEQFEEHCYRFEFSPLRSYVEAEKACIMNGATLVSVNTEEENNFISNWLQQFSNTRLHSWYTSGVDRDGVYEWEGDGSDVMKGDYWTYQEGQKKAPDKMNLVYKYSEKKDTFAWDWTTSTEKLYYVCEIDKHEAFRINRPLRDNTYGLNVADLNNIERGPKFTEKPQSIVFTSNDDTAVLVCVATGNPLPTYRWFRNTGSGGQSEVKTDVRHTLTGGRLTFSDLNSTADVGQYQCEAENQIGSVITEPATISIGYLNTFVNVKPGSVRAKRYQGTYISCNTPLYKPKVNYMWYKNDVSNFVRPTMNPHTFISENGRLYFSEVQTSDAGEYHCIVTLTAPHGFKMITSQPPSRTSLGTGLVVTADNANNYGPDIHNDFPAIFPSPPERGSEVRLECLAYGKLPLYYSWQKINGSLPAGTRFENHNRVLVIPSVQLEHTGTYRCHVTRRGAAVSKDIFMSVISRPYFLFPLADRYVDMDSQLTWRCETISLPRATYTWYKNTQPLTSLPGDVEIYRNVLVIRKAHPDKHNGMYQCVAENKYGVTSSSAELKVLRFKPNFDKVPVSVTLMGTLNGNVTIKCSPEAAPTPNIKWSHNGGDLGLTAGIGGRLSLRYNGDLIISQLTNADSGDYTCTATNPEGTASSTGHLSIVAHTVLTIKPTDTNVVVNETAFLFCVASYDVNMVDLVYIWRFEGKVINTEKNPHYVQGVRDRQSGLYIRNAQYKHAGRYTCDALTSQEQVSADATLSVYGPPGEPAGVFVNHIIGQDVELRWTPAVTTDSHAVGGTNYRVEVANNYDGWDSWNVAVDLLTDHLTYLDEDSSRRTTNISGLGAGTSYRFRVVASNIYGWGNPSLPSKVYHMNPGPPLSAPPRVGGGGGSVGELVIEWDPIPEKDRGGEKVGFRYKVYYRKLTSKKDGLWLSAQVKSCLQQVGDRYLTCATRYATLVGKENFYLRYEVKVQGINNIGEGPNSTVAVIFSAEEMPVIVPTNIYGDALNGTASFVTWNRIPDNRETVNGRIHGFQINWWNADTGETYADARHIRYFGDIVYGVVIGLQHNTNYFVNVQVFNGAGLSNPSEKYWLSTYYNPPLHYPFHVTVRSHGPDSVYLTWRGISTGQDEESIKGFKIRYWNLNSPMSTATDVVVGNTDHAVISPIYKDIVYQVRIMAVSLGGDGKKSPTVYFTLGGQIHLNELTTEILATGSNMRVSLHTVWISLVAWYFISASF